MGSSESTYVTLLEITCRGSDTYCTCRQQNPYPNTNADVNVSSDARGLNFCLEPSSIYIHQSELSQPIPWNPVESDLRCTSRIYFDNMTLTSHNVMLTSQKPCQHNNKCDCSKTNG